MIEFKKISKKYKDTEVVSNISMVIEKASLVVLIGSSGCGKTTLLKMVNRLIRPTYGDILINGKSVFDQDKIALRRNIGYVIQQTGLFPHMTVRQNIQIIPKLQKQDKEKIFNKTLDLMQMIGLDAQEYLERYPFELSGGQQQRIGVARAFACDPDVVLMDEPFSALDPITRIQLQDELVELNSKLKKTILFVTHDMDEAIKIADKICLINNGGIEQYDTVENLVKNPANEFVAEFIGKNRIWSSPEYIRAKDIMIDDPVCASTSLTISRAIDRMRRYKVDSLMVIDSNKELLGIAYAKDLRAVQDKNKPLTDVIITDFIKVFPDMNIIEVLELFKDSEKSSVPVLTGDKLVGLITKSSLLTTLSLQFSENGEVK